MDQINGTNSELSRHLGMFKVDPFNESEEIIVFWFNIPATNIDENY
ncbi:MAG: hypothetical protein IIB45_08475 [Candidatus Marinimicrobia bacterium]|nr:hypothetical protein [Candidatus Neomarinimicrobiota bacterium]